MGKLPPSPMRSPLTAFLLAFFVSISQLQVSAQGAAPAAALAAQVEVTNVRFNAVRAAGDVWLEAEIELDVKPGGKAVSGEYVDRVRTTLNVAFEATDGRGQKRNTFYRASVEAIALEGGKAGIRFYLPPEIVKRDRLRADVKFYTVDLQVGGAPQPPSKAATAADFKGPDLVKKFLDAVGGAEASANEGLLMPQHLTPFANDPQRHSPTILRREPQR